MKSKNLGKSTKPVTIAIGILCKERIVLAADSQSTRGNIKRTDAKKIGRIELKDGTSVAFAQAGNMDRAENVTDKFIRELSSVTLTDSRSASDVLQKVLIDSKREIWATRFNCSADELDDYFWKQEQDCDFMLAHYFDGKPYIFVGNLARASVSKRVYEGGGYFEAIGSGQNLAEYLLEQYAHPDMERYSAMAAAIFTISQVKRKDTYCSGDTLLALVDNQNKTYRFPVELVNLLSVELEQFKKSVIDKQKQEMAKLFDEVGSSWVKKNKEAKNG